MENKPPEFMTIEEVSEYLRVPVSSLYKLAQQGKIPASKVGRHWRFRREFIDRYIDDQVYALKSKAPDDQGE
ncbi:helix-turn-helix domain-containing protein [Anaerolinea sp.]|uniref:helix-turn-helix domain-containing protein n=1 Tax=Anaerolinea sp. TaxID=1872519 RepID=UPI002ACDED9E|nr:helix-turn-helix domain-containing protein [Anaerolinea sp.]